MDTERRNGRFSFEPDRGRLVVGDREAVLEPTSPPGLVVSTYLDLVVEQRTAVPTERVQLRDEELESLARMLALPPDELAALIDAELAKLLLHPPDGDEAAVETHARRRWLLLLAATIGLGAAVAGSAVLASESSSGSGGEEPGTTVEVVQLSDGSTATRTESAPVPPSEDTDIGTAVTYERNE